MAVKKSLSKAEKLDVQQRLDKRFIHRLMKAHADPKASYQYVSSFAAKERAHADFKMIRAVVYAVIDGEQKREHLNDELGKAITAACKSIRSRVGA